MKSSQFGIVFQVQGQRPDMVIVGSGANVASALRAKKIDPETYGNKLSLERRGVTLKNVDLTTRLQTNDLLVVAPDVAGGI